MTTATEIGASYGVGNDFFRLWLDSKMNYTCAVFDDTDDLDQAQLAKLAVMYDFARVRTDTRVLDIGCGWGANLEYLVRERQVAEVHGITLSADQHAEILRRDLPRVTAECVDYRDYRPTERFDAVISICMIEHVCRPEQAGTAQGVAQYRDYFRRAWEWTTPGASFGLQCILRDRVPRSPEDIRELGWFSRRIFPGGIAPRMEDIVQAVGPYWEIDRIRTRRSDYLRTFEHWLDRLRRHESRIASTWDPQLFADYERFLIACLHAFEHRYLSLAQWSLRRVDKPMT